MPAHRQKAGPATPLLAQAARLRQAGKIADSLALMRQATQLEPDNPHILHDFGLTLLQTGRPADAIGPLQRAIALVPDFAHAHWRLGAALENLGESQKAMASYRAALARDPSLHGAEYRLGCLLETAGHRKEASACYRRAAARLPKPMNYLAKAHAQLIERRLDEAERLLRRAITHDPKFAAGHALLGDILSEAGQFEEAASRYRIALEHAPGMVQLYYNLVRCRRLTQEDIPLLDTMRSSLARPGLQAMQKAQLNLALGKALDDLGDYPGAMDAFDAADTLRRQIAPFDVAAFEAQLSWATTTPVIAQSGTNRPNGDTTPVFVVGMPRSGTTLCEQILSAHPDIFGAGELPFWNSQGPALQMNCSADVIADLGTRYVNLIRQLAPGASCITDKMPSNFLWLGAIHAALPGAKFIHCRRNALDTCLSIHQTFFNPALKFPTGGEDLVAYYRGYEQIMAHWRKTIPADRLLEIDYEDLTSNPEPVIRTMIAHIGLPWNDLCLSPERNDRAVNTPSKWQVRQPINRDSVGRAGKYIPFLGELSALRP